MSPSDQMSGTNSQRRYRDREEYQLARALLADVCMSTRATPEPRADSGTSEASRLRRSAVALPGLFLPSTQPLSTEEERDSQRILLDDLAAALTAAAGSGVLGPEAAQRLDHRRRVLLERVEQVS